MPQFICAAILVILSVCSVALANDLPPVEPAASVSVETATTVETTQTSIQGQVQMDQQMSQQAPQQPSAVALTAADYLDVQLQPGKAKNDFQEFTLVLNNKQDRHLEILQLEVANGIDEQTYVQLQQEKSRAKKKLAGGLLRGVTSVASGFIPYAGLGSMAAYQAVGVGTHAAYAAASVVENTGGAVNYSGRIVQRASNIFVTPDQPFQCLAMVPEGQPPVVKVIFKDLQTNQIYDLNK